MDNAGLLNKRETLLAKKTELDEKIRKLQEEREEIETFLEQLDQDAGCETGVVLINRTKRELMGTAYQVKVVWKDADSPVWRRIAVPAWLTFEHLHRVICHVMDWDVLDLYTFQFDELNVLIAPAQLKKLLFPDAMSASDYVLDSCLELVKSFEYTYNLKERKAHVVTVEKRVKSFKGKLPVVLQMEGYTDADGDDDWLHPGRDPEFDLLFGGDRDEAWDEDEDDEDYSALLEDEDPYSVEELNADMDIIFDEAYWNVAY